MPTCESTNFADIAIMVIQFAAIFLALLVAMGFLQRGLKFIVDRLWMAMLKPFQKNEAQQ